MKRAVSIICAVVLCLNPAVAAARQDASGESNTPEETKRLDEIWKRISAYNQTYAPIILAEIRHFNTQNNASATLLDYPDQLRRVYPRTVQHYEVQKGRRFGKGRSGGRPSRPWIRVITGGIQWAAGLFSSWDAEYEQNYYNDLVDRGVDPYWAEREANYQSDRIAQAHLNSGVTTPAVLWAQIQELWEEMNDNSRYNLDEYFARTLAGPDLPLVGVADTDGMGRRNPPPTGMGGSYFIGGWGTPCVIVGPPPMPNQPPGTLPLPRFEDTITVTGSPLPPC